MDESFDSHVFDFSWQSRAREREKKNRAIKKWRRQKKNEEEEKELCVFIYTSSSFAVGRLKQVLEFVQRLSFSRMFFASTSLTLFYDSKVSSPTVDTNIVAMIGALHS